MKRRNCWEITGCGLEPGGALAGEYGVCSAAFHAKECIEGPNGGKGAGRACWAAENTLCDLMSLEVPATASERLARCLDCEVYRTVRKEEGRAFDLAMD